MKIVTMGMNLDTDFGHPSLLHGTYELLKSIYGDNVELTHYQFDQINRNLCRDFEFNIVAVPVSYKQMALYYIKWKFGMAVPKDVAAFFYDIKRADLVVDPFGIRFCDRFSGKKSDPYHMFRFYCSEFMPFIIAKRMKKSIIKTAASYGDISTPATLKSAKYIGGRIYSSLIAREEKSRTELIEKGKLKKEIKVSPDMANLFQVNSDRTSNRVGLSVSFQLERQFKGELSYVETIEEICKYIKEKYNSEIVLIPNQTLSGNARDDYDIAVEIKNRLDKQNVEVELIEIHSLTSTELKEEIASCQVIVGSRYHSCVAALSSGVPVLVLGWHHKYQELMELYCQQDMLMDVSNFSIEVFVKMFDKLWMSRESRSDVILDKILEVRARIITVGKEVFSEYGKVYK